MTETIKTKWQYIANRCYNEGHDTAEEIARQIDTLLGLLDMNEHTPEWIAAVEEDEVDYKDSLDIATLQEFCYACSVHDEEDPDAHSCDECRFYKAGGATLWNAFCNSYRGYMDYGEL